MTVRKVLCLILALTFGLAGCETAPGTGILPGGLPGGAAREKAAPDRAPPARPSLTASADPVAEAAPPPAATEPVPAPVPAPAPEPAPEPAADPGPAPGPAPEPAPEPEAAPEPTAPPIPEDQKSREQRACERKGGRYEKHGEGGFFYVCFTTPKDAGKYCTKESDCSTDCLARSRTCAPVAPLFGCHEILNERGARMTQCVQ